MKAISLPGCLLQVYFLHSMGCTECFLLAIMAFDRYLAIHRPLHYSTVMTRRLSVTLAATTWVAYLLYSSLHSVILSQLSFCRRSQEIHHYFCDIPALLQAACSDVSLGKSMLHVAGMGRAKAFSTCTSHITMVLLFYGTVSIAYVRPQKSCCSEMDRLVSLLYTIVTPTLNPVVYSLRNKEVKGALKRLLSRADCS
ncbi:olfactory receptor 6N2-like [Alligator mississippiensis]|uniref:olfactory receptor 6N2-like n=1 Tax=Alligator mississippiensis TaxID=8496 RepID=UPI0028780273|nr:olfactory receptor 6N2-like [Alligator mississippiensis]